MQIKNQFDIESLRKIGKGALIAGGGAALITLLTWLTSLDYGVMTPTLVALAGFGINAIKEYIKGSEEEIAQDNNQ